MKSFSKSLRGSGTFCKFSKISKTSNHFHGFYSFLQPAGLLASHMIKQLLEGPGMTGLLAFGTAALIYLAVEEVMKEAHRDGEEDSGIVNVALFIGILSVWLLDRT